MQLGAYVNETFQAREGFSPELFPEGVPTFMGHYHKAHVVKGTRIEYVGSPYQGALPSHVSGRNAMHHDGGERNKQVVFEHVDQHTKCNWYLSMQCLEQQGLGGICSSDGDSGIMAAMQCRAARLVSRRACWCWTATGARRTGSPSTLGRASMFCPQPLLICLQTSGRGTGVHESAELLVCHMIVTHFDTSPALLRSCMGACLLSSGSGQVRSSDAC
jgi:hypothetical protein